MKCIRFILEINLIGLTLLQNRKYFPIQLVQLPLHPMSCYVARKPENIFISQDNFCLSNFMGLYITIQKQKKTYWFCSLRTKCCVLFGNNVMNCWYSSVSMIDIGVKCKIKSFRSGSNSLLFKYSLNFSLLRRLLTKPTDGMSMTDPKHKFKIVKQPLESNTAKLT